MLTTFFKAVSDFLEQFAFEISTIICVLWLIIGTLWFRAREYKVYNSRKKAALLKIGEIEPSVQEENRKIRDRKKQPPRLQEKEKKDEPVGTRNDEKVPQSPIVLPNEISNVLKRLVEREYIYIFNWIDYQMISKVSGLASITFSVLGLASTYAEVAKWLQLMYGLLSIIFVFIILYLSPTRRVQQYLMAWRNVDKQFGASLARFGEYEHLGKQREKAIMENNEQMIEKMNAAISEAAKEIQNAIDQSEEMIPSEGE